MADPKNPTTKDGRFADENGITRSMGRTGVCLLTD